MLTCLVPVLITFYIGCVKIKKNSCAKGLIHIVVCAQSHGRNALRVLVICT
jgi:hypothetical protein